VISIYAKLTLLYDYGYRSVAGYDFYWNNFRPYIIVKSIKSETNALNFTNVKIKVYDVLHSRTNLFVEKIRLDNYELLVNVNGSIDKNVFTLDDENGGRVIIEPIENNIYFIEVIGFLEESMAFLIKLVDAKADKSRVLVTDIDLNGQKIQGSLDLTISEKGLFLNKNQLRLPNNMRSNLQWLNYLLKYFERVPLHGNLMLLQGNNMALLRLNAEKVYIKWNSGSFTAEALLDRRNQKLYQAKMVSNDYKLILNGNNITAMLKNWRGAGIILGLFREYSFFFKPRIFTIKLYDPLNHHLADVKWDKGTFHINKQQISYEKHLIDIKQDSYFNLYGLDLNVKADYKYNSGNGSFINIPVQLRNINKKIDLSTQAIALSEDGKMQAKLYINDILNSRKARVQLLFNQNQVMELGGDINIDANNMIQFSNVRFSGVYGDFSGKITYHNGLLRADLSTDLYDNTLTRANNEESATADASCQYINIPHLYDLALAFPVRADINIFARKVFYGDGSKFIDNGTIRINILNAPFPQISANISVTHKKYGNLRFNITSLVNSITVNANANIPLQDLGSISINNKDGNAAIPLQDLGSVNINTNLTLPYGCLNNDNLHLVSGVVRLNSSDLSLPWINLDAIIDKLKNLRGTLLNRMKEMQVAVATFSGVRQRTKTTNCSFVIEIKDGLARWNNSTIRFRNGYVKLRGIFNIKDIMTRVIGLLNISELDLNITFELRWSQGNSTVYTDVNTDEVIRYIFRGGRGSIRR
jgi:hypothetical protein